jgi:Protein of unknown function (DUF3563)
MKTAFRTLRAFFSSLAPSDQNNLEAYLAQSQDLADLEQREREWHRVSADRALMAIGVRSH